MGRALQVVSGFVTAPGATLTAWTMGSGDSLAVRNTPDGTNIRLLNMWAQNQVAGALRVRSPLLHDNVNGIRNQVVAAQVYPLIQYSNGQLLKPQDLLIVEQSGSGVGGQIESGSLIIYYEELPGAAARLATWDQIVGRIESYMVFANNGTPGVGGGYTGSQAINTLIDQWKANRDYALLGYTVSADCATVGWTGPDTSNLRVGGPGHSTNRMLTTNWFVWLNQESGLPTIPLMNAANKNATTMDFVQSQAGTAVTVTSIFALLK